MLSYVNRHPRLAACVLSTSLVLARLVGVPNPILQRSRAIGTEKQLEYAAGFLTWFTLFRLRLRLPGYNIYHLVAPGEKQLVADMLEQRLDEYRVAKQYYLLRGVEGLEDDFLQSVHSFLDSRMRSPGKNTSTKTRKFDTSEAFQALCEIDTLLKSAGLQPFLVSGTLLGVIRDNALIEGDNDLDIGIMANEASSQQVCDVLADIPTLDSVYNLGHLVQVTHNNDTVIDVFIHYSEDGHVWHGTDIHKWINTPFTLRQTDFQSRSFLIPDDAQGYLNENYGNWNSPVLFWDYSFDTPNREFFTNKKTVYFLAERILTELANSKPSRHAVQTAICELQERFGIDLTGHLGSDPGSAPIKKPQEKVVITFGTFDLFHIGHLKILERASALGDRLVVGVSSDAMNYGKKQTYPVYCQDDRISIVQSVKHVSDVFFEESLELKRDYIVQHKADILVMGDDWRGKFDHLSDVCEVVYMARTENISTSETKDSIKKNL